jgi:hypothetical protein
MKDNYFDVRDFWKLHDSHKVWLGQNLKGLNFPLKQYLFLYINDEYHILC